MPTFQQRERGDPVLMILIFTALFGLVALVDYRRGIRPFDRVR
jgi:hypothetical protein